MSGNESFFFLVCSGRLLFMCWYLWCKGIVGIITNYYN